MGDDYDRDWYRRTVRRAKRAARRERLVGELQRPLCWLIGHRWMFKMDLHGGALCGRCPAYLKPRAAYQKGYRR